MGGDEDRGLRVGHVSAVACDHRVRVAGLAKAAGWTPLNSASYRWGASTTATATASTELSACPSATPVAGVGDLGQVAEQTTALVGCQGSS